MVLRSSKTLCSRAKKSYWSSIHDDILGLVAGKIVSPDDYARFSAVCRSWYLFASGLYNNLHPRPYYTSPKPDSKCTITLLNPITAATLKLHLPEAAGSYCLGSPFGWLITHEYYPTDHRFTLVNLFTGAITPLPALRCSYSLAPLKTFLTANPDSDPGSALIVIVPDFGMSVFASKVWSQVEGDFKFSDVTYCKGKLYGLKSSNSLSVAQVFLFQSNRRDNGRLDHRFVRIITLDLTPYVAHLDRLNNSRIVQKYYIVDLNGELCLYVRYPPNFRPDICFRVFKIDLLTGNLTGVRSLDGHCLFLGIDQYNFSCKTTYSLDKFEEIPEYGAPKFLSNCVFYIPDNFYYEVEVWDNIRMRIVGSRKDSPTPLYMPFWILKFVELNA